MHSRPAEARTKSSQRVRLGSELSTHRRSSPSGAAPVRRSTTVPPSTSRKVGIDCTPKRRASTGEVSTFTLTSFNRPDKSRATCSRAGLTIRHGPHHSAHISTSTGMAASSTISSNSSSPLSVIHGRDAPHLPHFGTPDARSGTRFFVPQVAHVTTWTRGSTISVRAPSTTVPRQHQPRADEKRSSRCRVSRSPGEHSIRKFVVCSTSPTHQTRRRGHCLRLDTTSSSQMRPSSSAARSCSLALGAGVVGNLADAAVSVGLLERSRSITSSRSIAACLHPDLDGTKGAAVMNTTSLPRR